MQERTVKLVSFGCAGDTVEYGGRCRRIGYGSPENPHAADFSREDVPDGTPVIDQRPALETEEGARYVICGPMVDVDLPDGGCSRCPEPEPIFANAIAAASGKFAGLLAMQWTGGDRGPLDYVSLREYIAAWRALGARIGHYKNREIIWDD